MNIDRTRFLLLTAASAAAVGLIPSGCSGYPASSSPPPAPVLPVNTDSGTTTTDGSVATDGAIATDAAPDSATGSDGGACLGDTGTAANCATANATCRSSCEAVKLNFKVGIAASAAACIATLPSCTGEGLDPKVNACVDKALALACADATATTYCAAIAVKCTTFPAATCSKLASGWNAAGRASFNSCTDKGCVDPFDCADQLKY